MADKLADKIKKLRKDLGLTQKEFATRLGVEDQSLVSKWESGRQEPNAERMVRLADMAGQTIGQFMDIEPLSRKTVPARVFRVIGELQAGAWKEAVEWAPDDQYEVSMPLPPGVPSGIPLHGFIIRGNSMNKLYPDGTLVLVASTVANRLRPKNGQRVLVQRRNREGLYEATIKEYVVNEDGSKWLWPRSFDPEHQAPIPYKSSDVEEVTVSGIVMTAVISEALR